jgi:hypothetical protein
MKKVILLCLSLALVMPVQAFNLGDLKRTVDKSYKCKSGDQGCKNREHLKAIAKIAAVAVAVKLIADMVVKQRAKKVADEDKVVADYQKEHANLPAEPLATEYSTSALPGKVVSPGQQVVIQSDIVVVPGTKTKTTKIEERLAIFDNEDNTKELKSLTKPVNKRNQNGGRYQNEFTFTLPEGLPQGVYPIKTELLLNGKVVDTSANDIQLVMQVDQAGRYALLALR